MGKNNKFRIEIILIFIIVFLLQSMFVAGIGDWSGRVFVDGAQVNATSVVEAFNNGDTDFTSPLASATLGVVESSYYLIHVPSSTADSIYFRVDGLNASNLVTFATGPHDELNLSTNKTRDGVAGSSCTYSRGCAGAYCCSGATEYTDGSGTGTCQSSACSAAAVTPPSTGGGSGGAGGGAGAAAAVSESQTILTISAGGTATTTFIKTAIAITNVIITSKIKATNIRITITEASQPVDSPDPISAAKGATYKYVRITESVLGDDNIKIVKIRFKVTRSWLKDYDEDTVKLLRYKGGKWVELKTTKTKSTSAYVYYESESPGLTTFAITAEKKMSAFKIIDTIKEFYQGTSSYTAFEIIDIIKRFYGT